MKYLFYFFMITVVLLSSRCSCEDDVNGPNEMEGVLRPMAVGNYWEYSRIGFYKSNPDSIVFNHIVTVSITKSIEIDNIIFYRTNIGGKLTGQDGKIYLKYYANKEDGYYEAYIDESEKRIHVMRKIYNYPTKTGDFDPHWYTRTTNIDTVIKTDIGNFKCIEYSKSSYDDPDLNDWVSYYCPNIGLIHENMWTIDLNNSKPDTMIVYGTLVDYLIKDLTNKP